VKNAGNSASAFGGLASAFGLRSYNRAYLATVLRTSAQIPRFTRTSDTRQPLNEIARLNMQTGVSKC